MCSGGGRGGGGVQEGGGWCSKGFKVGFKKISIRSQDFSRPRKFLDKKLNLLKKTEESNISQSNPVELECYRLKITEEQDISDHNAFDHFDDILEEE